ncbi:MAG: hybrid sensor histidine kinase/response regulator [Magnetococcales bacterium]|nr:hybrid sensor histidine kinase/response regulator [Magnetococcales bacterium]
MPDRPAMSEPIPRILIVDDEKTNIDILVELLSDRYKTVVAKNGAQALKRANSDKPPNLILLDIMMPGMDGFEVCERLKQEPTTADIPIIFITGKSGVENETRALQAGGVDFIRKPFNPDVVLARIRNHLIFERQKNHLTELNQIKNRFLGMAAHDLRNPLNAICGLSELLLELDLAESDRNRYLQTIHRVGQQMLGTINDLLDVSVIESGHFDLSPTPEDLRELARDRIDLIGFAAEKKNITLQARLQATPIIPFDYDRLAQVIDNLLSNAIKFSPPGSEVTILVGESQGRLFFRVMDQGPGIDEAERDKLFGTFQKLTARPTGNEKSTGLGLAIVKKIIDAHQGEIQVESQPGKGSTFSVYLTLPDNQGQVD